MEAFSDYSHTSLWNSDDLAAANGGADGQELQSAALSSLIEDKEIAARAVAIVIGSARRGVVSLCADVAELLKSKQNLERQISRLISENNALRNSSSASSQPDVCDFEFHSGSANTSGYHSRPTANCAVEVHVQSKTANGLARPSSNPAILDLAANMKPHRSRRRHLSNQWPAVSGPSQNRTEQDELASLREEVRAALRANAAIVNELMATKQELNRLRGCQTKDHTTEAACPLCLGNPPSLTVGTRPSSVPPGASHSLDRSVPFVTTGTVSLLGCACRHCFLLRRQGYPRRFLQLTTVKTNQTIQIKDSVSLIDGRKGCVKYMGHIDNDVEKDPNVIWLGVEFDEPVGSGDGKMESKRYFSCRPRHGEFVRLEEVDSVFPRSVFPSKTSAVTTQEQTLPSSAFYITDFI